MASEDLFQNDYSEEPELAQDLNKSEELNINEAEDDDNDAAQQQHESDQNSCSAGVNTPPAAAATTSSEPGKATNGSKPPAEHEPEAKLTQLPMSRIRNIMKLDPDLQIASNEAVFVVTKSVELFIESLARESFSYTAQSKKKTVQKTDVDLAISAVDSLMFLDGALNF